MVDPNPVMCVYSTYQFFRDFAQPIATATAAITVAMITAYFARRQAKIADDKLRFDLYSRRFAMVDGIFDAYYAMFSWSGTPEQEVVKIKFMKLYHESQYLFTKNSGIESLLDQLNKDFHKVIDFKETDLKAKDDLQLYLKQHWDSGYIQTHGFTDGLEQLKTALYPYLYFGDLSL
jgi:hypothetical protein